MERHTYIRLAKIDNLLRENSFPNCRKLAEKFELSQRTILRDIEAMKDSLGAPIVYSREKNGYYYESKDFSLPKLKLSEGEIISVYLGTEILKKYKNTPFGSTIEQAFKKIELLLPKSVSIDSKNISDSISFDIEHCRELDKKSAKVFDALAKAIKNKISIEVKYYSIGRDKVSKRILDPYHLRHTLGTWYLVAYCNERKDVRTFAVDQIKEIKLLKQAFEVQKSFSPEKFFAASWKLEEGGKITKVVVKLDKSIARWFYKRKLHPSQQTKKNKDGSLTLTFQVAGTEEIKRWILSQGSKARVLEPLSLRKEIREEAREMLHK